MLRAAADGRRPLPSSLGGTGGGGAWEIDPWPVRVGESLAAKAAALAASSRALKACIGAFWAGWLTLREGAAASYGPELWGKLKKTEQTRSALSTH